MPHYGRRRRKHRTHVHDDPSAVAAVPRSFIIKRDRVGKSVQALVTDLRRVMSPNTASDLRESKKNKIRDFVGLAGPLGVSHMLVVTQSEIGPNLRLFRLPQGPTLVFRVDTFSLMKDIAGMQKRPVDTQHLFSDAPLVICSGFRAPSRAAAALPTEGAAAAAAAASSLHLQIMNATFLNMFPSIDLSEIDLKRCRRVVLFAYAPETGQVELRHFKVGLAPVGLSKGIRKVARSRIPDLSQLSDVSDYVLDPYGAAMSSDSEAEDTREAHVPVPAALESRGLRASSRSAVRLKEIGPRVTLSLLKIMEGVDQGEVLFHAFDQRAVGDVAVQRKAVLRERASKSKRRAEQEANKKRNDEARKEKKRKRNEKFERRTRRREEKEAAEAEGAPCADSEEEHAGLDQAAAAAAAAGVSGSRASRIVTAADEPDDLRWTDSEDEFERPTKKFRVAS